MASVSMKSVCLNKNLAPVSHLPCPSAAPLYAVQNLGSQGTLLMWIHTSLEVPSDPLRNNTDPVLVQISNSIDHGP